MAHPARWLLSLALIAPAAAQKVEVEVREPDGPQRIGIHARFQATEENKVLVNGQERGGFGGGAFGGRGGQGSSGPQETVLEQDVEFVQGPASDDYRDYVKLAAKETMPGRDGQPRETVVEGGLQGRKVWLGTDEAGGVVLREGRSRDSKPLEGGLARLVPPRVSLSGIAPKGEIAVGEEYDLSKSISGVLRCLAHPVVPAANATPSGEAGDRASRSGEDPRQGQIARGARGGAGFGGRGAFARRMGPGGAVLRLLGSGKLAAEAKGRVAKISREQGADLATIEFTARLRGKGDARELGLEDPAPTRPRRGDQGGTPFERSSRAEASLDLKGTATVDLTHREVTRVSLEGEISLDRESRTTMSRDGEDFTMERTTRTKGRFGLEAKCEPVEEKAR